MSREVEARPPRVLIVYYTLTRQVGRVVEALADEFGSQGSETTTALIEFTDERWVPKLSEFPMRHPFPNIASILMAQLRHSTGEIVIPEAARSGDYDLVVLASPTWWFQTSMPIRSYLESPEAEQVLAGSQFACVSVSRRYFSINLRQQKRLGEKAGGHYVDNTHFVVAGGQVKSMVAWLAYMKHGVPQERALGMSLPPSNLQPSYDRQAREFVQSLSGRASEGASADG